MLQKRCTQFNEAPPVSQHCEDTVLYNSTHSSTQTNNTSDNIHCQSTFCHL